ncbi:putative gp80 [Mycobacterium xenopi 3993]|nr:putative gp80 [Mycobacterium xenopi 3993]
MPNAAVAGLIAQRLPEGLLHPGDPNANQPAKLIPLPGLRSTGIPPEMAKQFAAQAGLPSHDVPKLIGEAIVYLLETEGFAIIPSTELEQLRTQAADAPTAPGSSPCTAAATPHAASRSST